MGMEHIEGASGLAAKISVSSPSLCLPSNNCVCLFCVVFCYLSYFIIKR